MVGCVPNLYTQLTEACIHMPHITQELNINEIGFNQSSLDFS